MEQQNEEGTQPEGVAPLESPPASPRPRSRPAIIVLSPRQSPTPESMSPAWPPGGPAPLSFPQPTPSTSTAVFVPPSPTLVRAVALRSFLDRRLQLASSRAANSAEGTAIDNSARALPPRELDDWREVQERSTADLEDELRELIRESNFVGEDNRALRRTGSASTLVLSEAGDHEDEDDALFISSLLAGSSSRRRRRPRPAARSTSDRDASTLIPPPRSRESSEDDRGLRTYPLPRRNPSEGESRVLYRSTLSDDGVDNRSLIGTSQYSDWREEGLGGADELERIWDQVEEDMLGGLGGNNHDNLDDIWGASPPRPSDFADETSSTIANTNAPAPLGGEDWTYLAAQESHTEELASSYEQMYRRYEQERNELLDFSENERSDILPPLERLTDDEDDPSIVWRHTPLDIPRNWASANARGARPLYESVDEVEWRRRSQAPPPLNSDPVVDRTYYATHPATSSQPSTTRQRNLYDATFLIGHTLRSKKEVVLAYCGGKREHSPLPQGFKWDEKSTDEFSSGCGTLICARGLAGTRGKVFESEKGEESIVSSDLPPPIQWIGDVKEGPEEEKRGTTTGCEGCRTKDVGCRACGNVLGFRVVRSCDHCATSRAVADGLLWHFRSSNVTIRHRLNSIPPSQTLSPPSSPPASPSSTLNPSSGRLESVEPTPGSKMLWRNIPPPQIDFEEGLLGEPSEWLAKGVDNWWLDFAARHSRDESGTGVNGIGAAIRRENSRRDAGTTGWGVPARNSLAIDLPSRNVNTPPTADTNEASDSIFSPRRSSLNRSYAIRLPRTSASNPSSSEPQRNASYNRPTWNIGSTRPSVSQQEENRRRVRARMSMDDEEDRASEEADTEVDQSLMNAGYGSAFRGDRRGRLEELRRRRDSGIVGRRSPVASSTLIRAGR